MEKTKHKRGKLIIFEPWEYYNEGIDIFIVDKYCENYLFLMTKPLLFNEKNINYLVGKLRGEKSIDLLSKKTHGTFELGMAFSDKISELNFRNHLLESFRGNFLLGELKLKLSWDIFDISL